MQASVTNDTVVRLDDVNFTLLTNTYTQY